MALLAYDSFKKFDSSVALSVVDATTSKTSSSSQAPPTRQVTAEELGTLINPFDMKRLNSYADNMVEYHVILDLVPVLASLYFGKRLGAECTLSAAQQAILLALGLQRKPVEALEVSKILTIQRIGG